MFPPKKQISQHLSQQIHKATYMLIHYDETKSLNVHTFN
jgi:hypothetical protein